jgi:hypothetical protein
MATHSVIGSKLTCSGYNQFSLEDDMQDKLRDLLRHIRELDTAVCEALEDSKTSADVKMHEHVAVDLVNRSLELSSELTQIHISIITQHN